MREQRKAELEELLSSGGGWRKVKAIAESFEPPITKPEGGWDDAIQLILDAEFPDERTVAEPEAQPVAPVYPVEFLRSAGISACDRCGSPKVVSMEGSPHCPLKKNDCPMLGI